MSDTYRVTNTPPEAIEGESWGEQPSVLDTFVPIPDGNQVGPIAKGSYPLRSMGLEEALITYPIILSLLTTSRVEVRDVEGGVQILVKDYYQYSEGLKQASSTRRQWARTLSRNDWDKVVSLASMPLVIELFDKLPASLSPISPEWQEYSDRLEVIIRTMYDELT